MKMKLIALSTAALLICACDPGTSDTPAPEQKGREETRTIRNTKEIGYSGDAIADKVDKALDANEEHAEKMKELEEQTQ